MSATNATQTASSAAKPQFNRKNPLVAQLKKARVLTGEGSEKDTRHFEISLMGSGLEYEPGDSLALFPQNCPELVTDVLEALGFTGGETVTNPDGAEVPLRQALTESYSITQPDKKLLAAIAEKAGAKNLETLLLPERKEQLQDYLWGREVIDFLLAHPEAKFEPQEFVGFLKKLVVRLYSIASSLKACPDEVHLTVATVTFHSYGRDRKGVCSTFLAQRVDESTPLPCFISPGKGFRLPAPEEDTPIIMCGPGTGIAPFRAFLQERKVTNAKGDAWLFFGEQHEKSDFFYRDEFEAWLADGTLTKLDTAFSRDQDHKIYVQHRIAENGAEFWQWLERGAIFYVCGDAQRMAGDVDQALHDLISQHGGKTEEEAADYVNQMKKDKRYRRDVY